MKSKHLKQIVDSVGHLPMFRADVQTGIFAKQLVTVTLSELFRHEFPETKWMNGGLIPITTNVSDGAKEYSFIESIHNGRAEIVADNADDIPAAEVSGRNNLRSIKTVAVHITYSTQDIRSARLQGMFDIATEKASAAREANDRALDDLIRVGNDENGLMGVVNHPGIVVQNATNGSWSMSSDPNDVIEDVTTAINAVMNNTDAVEVPNTFITSVSKFNVLSTLRIQTGVGESGTTVLEFLKKAHPMVTRWDWEFGMKNVSASGSDAALIYNRSPSKLRAVFPMMMRALPPEQRGLSFKINFETRFGGVMMPKPRSVLRLDGI